MPKAAKRNSDHAQKHHTPTINNEAIASHLEELLTPAIFAQQKYYKQSQSPSWIYRLFLHPLDKSAITLTSHG